MVVATKLRHYRKGVLVLLARLLIRFPWQAVICATLLGALGGYWAYEHLGMHTDPNDLLEPDSHSYKNYAVYLEEFRKQEDLIVVVLGPNFTKSKEGVDWIATEMKKDPDLAARLFYKINFDTLDDRMLFFVDSAELKKIDEKLAQFSRMMGTSGVTLNLNSMLDQAQRQLDPDYMDEEGNWEQMQPFLQQFIDNLNSLADRLEGKKQPEKVEAFGDLLAEGSQFSDLDRQKSEHEYLAFNQGKILLLSVKPDQEISDGDFFPHKKLIEKVQTIIEEARGKFPGLEIGLTGEPILAQDEMQASTSDMQRSTLITLVLISGLFFFAYREFWRPFCAIVALLVGVAWTLGFAAIIPGHLNILSQAFVAMILGLGIDFGIQILGRYEEALSHGLDVESALEEVMTTTGGAIITGGSTTAAAFYTMCFNQFKGLAELGIIAGTGVLLCLIAELVLLPAMMVIRDRKRKRLPDSAGIAHWGSSGKLHLFLNKYALSIVCVSVAATVLSIWAMRVIDFDYNLLNLQSQTLESVRFEKKLLSSGSQSMIFAISVVPDLKEAEKRAAEFEKLPSVLETASITSVIPKNQEEKMAQIKKIRSRLEAAKIKDDTSSKVNVTKARQSLQQLKEHTEWLARMSKEYGGAEGKEASKVFDKLVPPIARALNAFSAMSQQEVGKRLNAHQYAVFGEMQKNLKWLQKQRSDRVIGIQDVPPELRERYLGKTGQIMIEIYPKFDIWDREPLAHFVDELRTVDPEVTGTPVQNYVYIELLKVSYLEAVGEAMVAITVFIMLHFAGFRSWVAILPILLGVGSSRYLYLHDSPLYVALLPTLAGLALAVGILSKVNPRGLKHVCMTLLPLGLGIAWTLLCMPVFGLRFNPANIITLPLVVGAGVAYGVYTVDRYRETGSSDIWDTSTGKAVLLSALTTIFGFGSLIIARHQGIASLGELMTLGIAMCMLAALYVLPALIELSHNPKTNRPVRELEGARR